MTSIDGDLSLARILWIGGATDAGKTTTVKMLAERYDFQLYQHKVATNDPRLDSR